MRAIICAGAMSRLAAAVCTLCGLFSGMNAVALPEGIDRVLVLPPSEGNPRNSEGDFITLRDGRIVFVYTHFTDGAADHSTAHLAGRVSSDGGKTWSAEDTLILPNEGGMNIMSVSLLRLQDGRIALLYLRKNVAREDCMPYIRFSDDEMETWSDPVLCIPEGKTGYYVVNNDRLVQLQNGRLVIPAALHLNDEGQYGPGRALCLLSDDAGAAWRLSASVLEAPATVTTGLQEPGIIELRDGRLWMFCRTNAGVQYESWSEDGGDTWTMAEPGGIVSPVSPATVEAIPETGDWLMVWNNHAEIPEELQGKRTPFTAAISKDEGKTWTHVKNIEDNPHRWYCYTAMLFHEGHVLLGHCSGDRRESNGLAESQILRVPIAWIYQ